MKSETGLNAQDATAFRAYEEVIHTGMATVCEVGMALLAIRDQRLYRAEFATFEEYLAGRWQMKLSRAKQLIVAAQVEEDLSTNKKQTNGYKCSQKAVTESKTPLPKSEGVSRELAKVPREERKDVWETVVATAPKDEDGNPKITAATVAKAVKSRVIETTVDAVGGSVEGAELVECFSSRDGWRSLSSRVSALDKEFTQMSGEPGGQFASRHLQEWTAGVKNLRQILRFCIPHAVCPYCKGKACDKCRKAGWLPEEIYRAIPKDIRGGR